MTSNEIRKAFLDFFASKDHHIVPSAPMVVKNDPTLMFTNAGMNQFKDIFLGNAKPQYPRVSDSQKCLRVSGKHNDLEEVGRDTYHHTMFEMLGNWSFGDYFKKEAIAYAWEFLTEVMHIDKSNLYVTVFGGDASDHLEMDTEAYQYWTAHVPEDHILKGSKKDNFWEMGDQGPCGPCSEIHIDLRGDDEKSRIKGSELVNQDNPQVIEIWNLVFMQFNRLADGTLVPLAARHIDTGMGFERLCMVLQGKHSNYDTDIFQPLIQHLASLSHIPYGQQEKSDIAMRVCADHLRAVAFSIADGQLPSNVKAGYVIRRILRRAVRYGYTFLALKEPFLNTMVPVLVSQMGHQFPELAKGEQLIQRIILEEEQAFLKTLQGGIARFDDYVRSHESAAHVVEGDFAFELFDTYGFPVDLTQLMSSEIGWTVDMDGFARGLEQQKQRSRAAAAVENDDWVELKSFESQQFVGYDTLRCEAHVARYRRVKSKEKTSYQIVFDSTPFYGESGGQVGDKGRCIFADASEVKIVDAKKENNLTVHIVPAEDFEQLLASAGDLLSKPVTLEVNAARRRAVECNHSATHLLHKALRKVLGTHVEQRGSSVDDARLRFDFSHFAKLTPEELHEVERHVNADIRRAIPLEEYRAMPIEEAKTLGAMALFGEKYGDKVRVVKFAESVEFCGGTHVPNTGCIGSLRIVAEGAVAAGMRRIEAVTAASADSMVDSQRDLIEQLREQLKAPKDIVAAVARLQDDNAALRSQADELLRQQAVQICRKLEESVAQSPLCSQRLDVDLATLKEPLMQLRERHPDLALVLGSTYGGKPSLLVVLGQNRVDGGLNASTIVRAAGKEIQGGGGGTPAYATAGGKKPDGIDTAIKTALAAAQ